MSGATLTLATVDGRVLTSDGRGLRNATVSITDSLGASRTLVWIFLVSKRNYRSVIYDQDCIKTLSFHTADRAGRWQSNASGFCGIGVAQISHVSAVFIDRLNEGVAANQCNVHHRAHCLWQDQPLLK